MDNTSQDEEEEIDTEMPQEMGSENDSEKWATATKFIDEVKIYMDSCLKKI